MQISKNFTLEELLSSQYAERNNIEEQTSPTKEVIGNLTMLTHMILQPLRDYVGYPISVNSAFRCLRVNGAIGGAVTSQHVLGQAADLKSAEGNAKLFDAIIDSGLPFDQLIWEGGNEVNPAWVHVSYSNRNRREVLKATFINGKAQYTEIK